MKNVNNLAKIIYTLSCYYDKEQTHHRNVVGLFFCDKISQNYHRKYKTYDLNGKISVMKRNLIKSIVFNLL